MQYLVYHMIVFCFSYVHAQHLYILNQSAALVTGTSRSSVIIIFRLSCVLYFAFSIRDVPVEHNPQYLILSLYCIFPNKLKLSEILHGSTLAVFRYPEHPRFSDGIPDSP